MERGLCGLLSKHVKQTGRRVKVNIYILGIKASTPLDNPGPLT